MTARPKGIADLEEIEAVFSALAHPNRRQILTVLRVRGGSMTSGDLASRFECTWPTTTRHLRVLVDAGLLRVQTEGRERQYQLDVDALETVAGAWIQRFQRSPVDDANGA